VEGDGGNLQEASCLVCMPQRFVSSFINEDRHGALDTTFISTSKPDFVRLVRKYQIERPAGEILCGPLDNIDIPKVSDANLGPCCTAPRNGCGCALIGDASDRDSADDSGYIGHGFGPNSTCRSDSILFQIGELLPG